jgi:hypothetical protein
MSLSDTHNDTRNYSFLSSEKRWSDYRIAGEESAQSHNVQVETVATIAAAEDRIETYRVVRGIEDVRTHIVICGATCNVSNGVNATIALTLH